MAGLSQLHAAVSQVIAGQTYTPYSYPSPAQITHLKGVGSQIYLPTPEYEIGYHILRRDSNTLNVYCRTGADAYVQVPPFGNVVVRTFLTDSLAFDGSASDRQYVYQPTDWTVFDHCEYIINNSVWMFTLEKLRADMSQVRMMVQISTDGLVGRAFGAPIQVVVGGTALTNTILFCANLITDTSGNIWVYFSCESPTGLYRMQVNPTFDGTFSNYSRVSTQTISEACVATVDNTGKLVCVFRAPSATYLQQMTSANNGASWTAGVSTGLGLTTGVKVQPRIKQSADPSRFIVTFMDRAAQSYDRVSTQILKSNAYANNYRQAVQFGPGQSNGNSDVFLIDAATGIYLYIACNIGAYNVGNGASYWVYKDSLAVSRRPWI